MLMSSSLRIGPELEITGYGCLDHFLESVSKFLQEVSWPEPGSTKMLLLQKTSFRVVTEREFLGYRLALMGISCVDPRKPRLPRYPLRYWHARNS